MKNSVYYDIDFILLHHCVSKLGVCVSVLVQLLLDLKKEQLVQQVMNELQTQVRVRQTGGQKH